MTPHRIFPFCRGVQSAPAGCCHRVGLSRVNAERAADYSRIDIRVDRTFTIGGQPLNLFFGCRT